MRPLYDVRREGMAIPKKKTSLGLISLMLFSLFSALIAAPSASAIEQIDLAIVSAKALLKTDSILLLTQSPSRLKLRMKH